MPSSLIARPDGFYHLNTTGSPALAVAGQGDVLSGLIAALLAQGLDAFSAASSACYLHGLANTNSIRRKRVDRSGWEQRLPCRA
ncbi:NAD(P)H-hydrate dehydratase [Paludibacterium denitrificans]|uniref:NAD(P)H-hydrate dehydratase n=1 Tax=Paludibacterium denitrificans TaxID=2675226 RepID=UPI0028AD3076|nr:NAD(P)H-hydrate dehydratase [Paludibacterium denitrificans]